MTLMTSHVGDIVVKTLEDRCGWCTLSGCKCYSISAIILKFEDNICTKLLNEGLDGGGGGGGGGAAGGGEGSAIL